jgi:hypothetical protein
VRPVLPPCVKKPGGSLRDANDRRSPEPEPVKPFVLKFEPVASDEAVDDFCGEDFDGSEDLEEEEAKADEFFDEEAADAAYAQEEENEFVALLTPEIMEKMLANMCANGMPV